jgi:hypothetical protein
MLLQSCACERDCRDARRAHLGRVEDGSGLDVPHGAACRSRRWCRLSKRILVVEDQEDFRAILRDFLSASGYTVIEAPRASPRRLRNAPISCSWTSSCLCSTAMTRRGRSRRCPIIAVSSFVPSFRGEMALTLCAMIGRVDPKALRQTFKGDAVA